MLKRAILVAFLGAVLLTCAYPYHTESYDPSTAAQHAQHDNNEGDACSRIDITCTLGAFVYRHREVINASSTLAIATFTLFLFGGTMLQWHYLRKEFRATHRPRIKIIAVKPEWKDPTSPESIRYEARAYFVNEGAVVAYVKEIRSKITARLDAYALNDFDGRVVEKTELASGEEGEAWVSTDWVRTQGNEIAAVNAAFPPHVYCVGFIRYEDSAKGKRKTGFCYWYDGAKAMWVEERDSPLNYSY